MMPRYVPRTEASKKSPYDRRLKHLVGAGYAASFASVGNFSALFRNPSDRGTNDLGQSSLLPLDRGGPLCLCLYDTPVIFTFQPLFQQDMPLFSGCMSDRKDTDRVPRRRFPPEARHSPCRCGGALFRGCPDQTARSSESKVSFPHPSSISLRRARMTSSSSVNIILTISVLAVNLYLGR